MTWRNPWAWLGLLSLAVPLLVHLLARRRSRRIAFPTLRFLEATPPAAVRRSRLSDPLLMALRMLVLGMAVAALAQPYLPTADRTARAARAVSVVAVVDTSWSMERPTPDGERALDVARRGAEEVAADASTGRVIETASPGEALAGAAAWLEGRPGVREIHVLSDFQRGGVDSVDLARLPPGVGVELRRIPVEAALPPRVIAHGRSETHLRATAGPDGTDATWARHALEDGDRAPPSLRLLHARADSARADALHRVLDVEAVPAPGPARPVTVLFPGFEDGEELLAAARSPSDAWMGEVILRLVRDEGLARLGPWEDAAWPALEDGFPDALVPVVTAGDGRPLVLAGALEHDGERRLLIVAGFAPGTLASASLLAGIGRAADVSPPRHELEGETLTAEELERWSRAGAPVAVDPGDAGDSDGQWVWIVVLIMLLAEGLLRRRMRERGV